ncbi:GntR family transcriptional regulator/MocR family aminotransferase [Mycetocola sp. BIGb0189]|uniref:MocR-like pyridoxine biosynthesis transcription factor PdxR n=1 Tax=Mycetocola sp. BIGb0189 TaxID=2940604 RepID=UPI002168428F|nr:PLP-dependent aminotransferase family protein [Mycetocola sp. BIGb0189]MCS4276461.1 GntR family transcriptional regulator/MocR family aminotransferase [Mycetocola sp. BIGb0189]
MTLPGRAGVDLHLDVAGTGIRAGLASALREAIATGRLSPGTRLPASRALALDLGIARSSVTECYAELIAEGWLIARQGSGTRVAARPDAPASTPAPIHPEPRSIPAATLVPGAANFAEFPRSAWLSAARRALAVAPHSAFGYGDPQGRPELRRALADYLGRVRGVRADPERIVITAGFADGLGLMARALHTRGAHTVAAEAYGLGLYRRVLADAGLAPTSLAVDDAGARIEDLAGPNPPAAVLLTPAHQFPSGVVLSPERRSAAIAWARGADAVILEDDYDGEFRYDRRPVGALQGLDPERVVYFGTASKSLAPALRIAWMVVPERLMPAVLSARGPMETVSALEQLTLAEFITSGACDRHVRMRRQSYRRRRDQLVDALTRSGADVRVSGVAAGLQAVLELPAGTERRVLHVARERGVMVSGLSEFRQVSAGDDTRAREGLVVNFSAVSDAVWESALAELCRIIP